MDVRSTSGGIRKTKRARVPKNVEPANLNNPSVKNEEKNDVTEQSSLPEINLLENILGLTTATIHTTAQIQKELKKYLLTKENKEIFNEFISEGEHSNLTSEIEKLRGANENLQKENSRLIAENIRLQSNLNQYKERYTQITNLVNGSESNFQTPFNRSLSTPGAHSRSLNLFFTPEAPPQHYQPLLPSPLQSPNPVAFRTSAASTYYEESPQFSATISSSSSPMGMNPLPAPFFINSTQPSQQPSYSSPSFLPKLSSI